MPISAGIKYWNIGNINEQYKRPIENKRFLHSIIGIQNEKLQLLIVYKVQFL